MPNSYVKFWNEEDEEESILYKLLLVLIENKKIKYAVAKNYMSSKSGYSMNDENDYKKLIKKLKEYKYISTDDNVEIKINFSKDDLEERDLSRYHCILDFSIQGKSNLTEIGKNFIKNYKENFIKNNN